MNCSSYTAGVASGRIAGSYWFFSARHRLDCSHDDTRDFPQKAADIKKIVEAFRTSDALKRTESTPPNVARRSAKAIRERLREFLVEDYQGYGGDWRHDTPDGKPEGAGIAMSRPVDDEAAFEEGFVEGWFQGVDRAFTQCGGRDAE